MTNLRRALLSTIGTKLLVSLSGLCLLAFVIAHLAGNLLVFLGPESFNLYSDRLVRNKPLLYGAEAGLLAVLVVHVVNAVRVTVGNRAARDTAYARRERAGPPSRKSLASSTMLVSGGFLAVFTVLHLRTFKWGAWYTNDAGMRDLYRLVLEVFHQPGYVAFYLLSMAVLGLHLRHGFASAFQSLGVDHAGLTATLLRLGLVTAVAIAVGFGSIPLVIYLTRTGS